jgi:hypothetical protein
MDKRIGRMSLSGIGRCVPLVLCLVASGLIVLQVGFAVRYLGDSFPKMTKYADSKVYMSYTKGRKISAVRAVMYPLILRQLARISRPDLHLITYSVQLIFTFLSSLYFCFGLLTSGRDNRFDRHRARSWLVLLLPPVAMLTDPLNLHLDLAVMPDSLTSSMALIFVGSLVFIWSRAAARYRAFHIGVCLVSFITLSLMRLEKPIVGSLVLAIMFVFCLVMFLKRRDRGTYGRLMILLICVLVIGGVLSRGIDRRVPRRRAKDESMSNVRLVLANRVALGVLDRIYEHLSEDTRLHITPEVVDEIKVKRKNFNLFMIPFIKSSPEEGREILDDMIRTAVRMEGGTVLRRVMEDLCLYLGTPLAWHYQLVFKPPSKHYTVWTFRNMKRQAGPEKDVRSYVDIYLQVSGVLLICVLAGVCAVFVGHRRGRQDLPPLVSALLIVLLFHCMNSFFFAFLTSRFHIRYALPSYRLVLLTCYVVLFAHLCNRYRSVGDRG